MKKVIGIVAACMLLAGTSQAKSGSVGLAFGGGMNLEAQKSMLGASYAGLSYWLDDDSQIEVSLLFSVMEKWPVIVSLDGNQISSTSIDGGVSLGASLGYKRYLNGGEARGFAKGAVGFEIPLLDEAKESVMLNLSAGLGVEYFFNENVAVSASTALAVNFIDQFKSYKLGLGQTGVSFHLYW